MEQSFEAKLRELINSCSKENESDTPDYILAEYLNHCLDAFNYAAIQRDSYRKGIKIQSKPKTPVQNIVVGMKSMEDIITNDLPKVKISWTSVNTLPPLGKIVEVKLTTGEIKKAMYNKDVNRTCWLFQGAGQLFWRSFVDEVIEWRVPISNAQKFGA